MTPGELGVLQSVALASLLAWASGLRLYLVVFAVGMAGYFDYIDLPKGLEVLKHPWVMGAAGLMLAMEFLADKVPAIDSAWDAIHTFIRIPAGALLAAGATGDSLTRSPVAAGLIGGRSRQAPTHQGGRSRRVNTSPAGLQLGASFPEDALVVAASARLHHPLVFLLLLLLFPLMLVWLIRKSGAASRRW